jgi:hypothetical protein
MAASTFLSSPCRAGRASYGSGRRARVHHRLSVVAVQTGLRNPSPSLSQAAAAEDEADVLQKRHRRSDLEICGCPSWTTCTKLSFRSCSVELPSLDDRRRPRFLSCCYCLELIILDVPLQFQIFMQFLCSLQI